MQLPSLSALALPLAAQAVEFAASGHINRAIISVDGGGPNGMGDTNDGDLQHVDANYVRVAFPLHRQRGVGKRDDGGRPTGVRHRRVSSLTVRQANVSLNTAGGKITLGHGSVATDGVTEANLGGPSWLGGVTHSCSYHSPEDASPACQSNDGGRVPSLRYDTPALGPATISTSIADDNDYWDIKLQIAGSFGDAGYDIRIGHTAEYETDVAAVAAANTVHSGADLIAGHETTAGLLEDLPPGAFVYDNNGNLLAAAPLRPVRPT